MTPARGTTQSLEGSPLVVDLLPSPTLCVHAAARDLQLHRTEIHITIKTGD